MLNLIGIIVFVHVCTTYPFQQRQASLSSSDEEIQTTPECTSCDEPEIESESVSEKGVYNFIFASINVCTWKCMLLESHELFNSVDEKSSEGNFEQSFGVFGQNTDLRRS